MIKLKRDYNEENLGGMSSCKWSAVRYGEVLFPCIKVGYRLFQIDSADTATQILFAGCRFTIAGIMVILFDRSCRDVF